MTEVGIGSVEGVARVAQLLFLAKPFNVVAFYSASKVVRASDHLKKF